ncbi:flagellin [Sporolactobacillus sp. THM19-2]|uniref:flagellin N-terminal helical domain-containing protein n=1 Tax=Sporolactobacillus sp. THM19-2 TaxID=2511171 RepID=UPI00102222E1|nr:flagellin [Sporolactobacillus sp. THM19-2]RYL93652.1 flagellin [Sporolactobacillus sp. THM19-2]
MIINHNIAALNTLNNLSKNTNATQKSLEKLSSGLRINRAGDDAAGLAISEKMRGQIRGLDMATKNSQDGISLIQTAEGSLNETHDILQRMRELAVQSANDTNTDADRTELQKEVDQLAQEVSRIGRDTEFNTQKLLNGSFAGTFQIGANQDQNLSLSINDLRSSALGITGNATISQTVDYDEGTNTTQDIADGTYSISRNITDGFDLKDANGITVATSTDGKAYTASTGDDKITFTQEVDSGSITIANGEATGVAKFGSKLEAGEYTANGTQLTDANGKVIATSSDGITFTSTTDGTTNVLTLDAALTGDTKISVGGVDISNQSAANAAITTFESAIESVSSERSKLGAYQNRLEHTINNLSTSSENLSAAESRIRDVDMAKEMSNFTKNNILNQAAQAMLAQANQLPQGVLQLLR